MTNAEIIMGAMMLAEVNPELEVDTFAGWKRRGFCVKRGEHAVFKTKIWKPSKFKAEVDETEEPADDEKKTYKKLILVNASFFTEEQVEKLVK